MAMAEFGVGCNPSKARGPQLNESDCCEGRQACQKESNKLSGTPATNSRTKRAVIRRSSPQVRGKPGSWSRAQPRLDPESKALHLAPAGTTAEEPRNSESADSAVNKTTEGL